MHFKFNSVTLTGHLVAFATCLLAFSFALQMHYYLVSVFIFALCILVAARIYIQSNKIQKKVLFFFEAIQNEDGALRFNERIDDKDTAALHVQLNRINKSINNLRIREAKNERFFMEFLKRSASGLIATDASGFVESINQSALQFIGLSKLTHLDRLKQHNATFHAVLLQLQSGESGTYKSIENNTLSHLSVQLSEVSFSGKTFRIYSIHNIKHELEANELETWQKLLNIMTHEIMNSIAPISSLTETLNQIFVKNGTTVALDALSETDIENTSKSLDVINERALGLKSFVNSYREISRLPNADFGEIHIAEWLDTIRLLFSGLKEETNVELTIDQKFTSAVFIGDEKLLTHVVLNLLKNALEAMEYQAEQQVQILTENRKGGGLRLIVSDNGSGIDPEHEDKIFMPFFSTRETGSGIGLSLSRQIMRMHKGSIYANTNVEKGAQFVIEL